MRSHRPPILARHRCASLLLAGLGGALASAPPAHAARPTAGALEADRLKLPSGPASVRGLAEEPQVDPFYSRLGYSVPIEVPEGWGKLAPALALEYSGALGNGPLGIGWELATARIERSRRLGVPSFTAADELELSGPVNGRLVAIGAGEYRVEGQGQTVRVRQVGAGFEVDLGDGRRLRLGTTAASRHEGQLPGGALRTSAWLLDEETSTTGERVTYQYELDQGQVYLARASWGPGGVYEVTLTYAPRPDATTSYREGFRVVTARRLQTVRVNAFATERRAYHLTYDDTFPVSRLAQVGSTGRAGVGAWPTLTFEYATSAAAAVTPMPGVGSWRLNAAGTVLVDLDSDGAADLLQLADGGHSYRLNQNGTFGAALPLTGNTSSISVLQLQDVDGDARADLLLDTGAGWSVWRWSKTKWLLQQGTWPGSSGLALKNPATTRFADLNGDGLIDGIKWNNDNLSIHQATRTGLSAPRLVPKIGGAVLPTSSGRFLDTNGDGLDDYVVVANDRLDVYVGRGDGTFDAAVARAYPFAGSANPDDLHLADLDRDDLLDLIRVDLGTVRWFRGRADGSFSPTPVTVANPEPLAADVVVTIGDVNGNGSQDLVWSSASNLWRLDLAGATTAGMLTRTRNGLGLDVSFTYRSAHALSVDARAANDPWQYEVPVAMPVPVRKQTALGPGETPRQVDYLVRDGYWDAVERRFGGFLGTIVTTWGATAAQTSSVQTRYHNGTGNNRLLRGKPIVEQVRNGTGQRLSITTNVWEAMLPAGMPDTPLARKAVLRESRTRYEEVTPVRESRVTYEYDTLGRQRRAVDYGRLDHAGDDSVRETTYADDATYWVRDLLCEDKVLTPGGALLSHRRLLYGDHTTTLAPCVIGKGWLRADQRYLIDGARFVTQRALAYDARGNAISVKEKGVVRELGYSADGLFLTGEQVTRDDGSLLAWSAVTDPVLGVVTAVTEPNGHTTRARYDDLGRPIGFALDARPDHLVVQYDWQAPYPKTTQLEFDGPLSQLGAPPTSWTPASRWRQTVEVANGRGDVRYRAKRLGLAQWILSDYQERDPASRVVFRGQATLSSALEHAARPSGMIGQSLSYDPLGRVLEQVLPTGARRTYTYAPFERTMSEDGLAQVRHVLDGKGRLIHTERGLGGDRQAVDAAYDAAGRLTEMTINSSLVRAFTYDSLGRLVATSDPDLGQHQISYDDANRVVLETNATGQEVSYSYDSVGRLLSRDLGPDLRYRFHYDTAYASGDNLLGRLAWVEEPTGRVELSYDEAGRTTWARRTIGTRSAWESTTYSPSGLVLARTFDDGLSLPHSYDAAGRVTGVGSYWTVQAQDAAGAVLAESFGNGASAAYQRDALGQVARVTVRDVHATALYDVEVTRNVWRAISGVIDHDGAGLDHSATFTYDPFARLTEATLGGAGGYQFSYSYDGLQNMMSRGASGPARLALLDGDYRYGENGAGPRQLTSVFDRQGQLHTLTYDAAGRQLTQDGLTMEFDALDQLLKVTGAHKVHDVLHAYGYEGLRVRTQGPDGTTLWFSESLSERNGVREHDIVVGERVVARVALAEVGGAQSAAAAAVGGVLAALPWAAALALLGYVVLVPGRRRQSLRLGAAGAVSLLLINCTGGANVSQRASASWSAHRVTYLHQGFGAGPALFTDEAGELLEERRYEPFGEEVDALHKSGSGYVAGAPDFASRDLNSLNKRTEPTTGWSYHGARWLAPETGRWLSGDPPLKTPAASQLAAPWGLHPYQYVDQNPVHYWDPDGHDKKILLFIGIGDTPEDEANALISQVGAQGVVAINSNHGTSSVVTEGTQSYDVSTAQGRQGFSAAVAFRGVTPGGMMAASFRAAAISTLLENANEMSRDELAQVVSVYASAQRGELTIERVVISGHHYAGDDEIWSGYGDALYRSELATLADIFPKVAAGVKDLGFSSCNTLTSKADYKAVKSMFPKLDTVWGYRGYSPATHTGAIEHMKRWEEATRGERSRLSGDEADGIRKSGNVRVKNYHQ